MKKVGLLSGVCLLLLLNFSCEKEIDLRTQTPPGQLYANSILNPDSVFRVFLSYSTPITAPLENINDRLDEATESLVIIKDTTGFIIDTLEFITSIYSGVNNGFLIFESIEGLRPLSNESYELYVLESAVNNNSKNISATASVPASFNIIQANKSTPRREVTGTDQTFGIELSWEDPSPQENNFFIIEVRYRNTTISSGVSELIKSELYSNPTENDNAEIGPANGKFFYIFIDDSRRTNPPNLANIQTKINVLTSTFDQWVDAGTPFSSEVLIHVHHVSRDLYNYYQDVEKYRINSSGTDIFAQPVPVRGNMQGGLGILGAEIVQEAILVYQ
jgi:hypothetical protein